MANGKIDPAKWYNVNEDARIWSGHAGSAQKQGWLIAPAAILAIDEYNGSFQFVVSKVVLELGGKNEIVKKSGYPDTFIRIADTSLQTYEDFLAGQEPGDEPPVEPPPVPVVGDAALGAAVRTVLVTAAEIVADVFGRGGSGTGSYS